MQLRAGLHERDRIWAGAHFARTGSSRQKSWFLDKLLAKYGQPEWSFEPGYLLIDRIILYEQEMEIITGKVAADQITLFPTKGRE